MQYCVVMRSSEPMNVSSIVSIVIQSVFLLSFCLFIFYLVYKTINNSVTVTSTGIKFSYLKCNEYESEIPWSHIDKISTGSALKNRPWFVRIDLKHDLLITKNNLLSFFSASAPQNYYLWNVRFQTDSSKKVAERLNYIRMNRNRLAKKCN